MELLYDLSLEKKITSACIAVGLFGLYHFSNHYEDPTFFNHITSFSSGYFIGSIASLNFNLISNGIKKVRNKPVENNMKDLVSIVASNAVIGLVGIGMTVYKL